VTDWVWISLDVILAIHDEQLAEHGGATGVRDKGMLESALGRPLNQAAYGEPDAAALAAAYAFGIARNHPFADGNKRTAYVAMELFLDLNGFELTASDGDAVLTMLRLAAGEVEEEQFADWIRAHLDPK
jgi:death-on-curing protein